MVKPPRASWERQRKSRVHPLLVFFGGTTQPLGNTVPRELQEDHPAWACNVAKDEHRLVERKHWLFPREEHPPRVAILTTCQSSAPTNSSPAAKKPRALNPEKPDLTTTKSFPFDIHTNSASTVWGQLVSCPIGHLHRRLFLEPCSTTSRSSLQDMGENDVAFTDVFRGAGTGEKRAAHPKEVGTC